MKEALSLGAVTRWSCGLTIHPLDNVELLRWWHQYQVQMLSQEADTIRNGLLQDVFAARRRLELICQSHGDDSDLGCKSCLTELEQIYSSLEKLSDRLVSPYLQSALPLALQHAVDPWQSKFNLDMTFPQTWFAESAELTQLLIALIDTFFHSLMTFSMQPYCCNIQLKHQGNSKELTFFVRYTDWPSPLPDMSKFPKSLTYMLETFQVLTQGEYTQVSQPHELGWMLHWEHQEISNQDTL